MRKYKLLVIDDEQEYLDLYTDTRGAFKKQPLLDC